MLTKEAEERGAWRLVRKEDGKCCGNSNKCSKYICHGTKAGGVGA